MKDPIIYFPYRPNHGGIVSFSERKMPAVPLSFLHLEKYHFCDGHNEFRFQPGTQLLLRKLDRLMWTISQIFRCVFNSMWLRVFKPRIEELHSTENKISFGNLAQTTYQNHKNFTLYRGMPVLTNYFTAIR